ncbi:MAG: hypothetical protein QNJ75_03400 [Acidimicrobiia bacterium]|nr:hypothetical protein [Acidimicrobiia bacterium]
MMHPRKEWNHPDRLNALAFRAIVILIPVVGLVVGLTWAMPDSAASSQGDDVLSTNLPSIAPARLMPASSSSRAAAGKPAGAHPAGTTTNAHLGSTPSTSPTGGSNAATPDGVVAAPPSTTSTTLRPTSPPISVSPPTTTTTTTVPPTTTTTSSTTTTTTTVPPPTTTTTTTVPPTTTTTTTTTTTIPLPGLFISKFEGHARGDEEAWKAHIEIEIRTEGDAEAAFAVAVITWGGTDPGSVSLQANNDGKIDERVGSFDSSRIKLTITQVVLDGHVYRPDLNTAPSSIVIEGPD